MNRNNLRRILKFIKEIEWYVEGGVISQADAGLPERERRWTICENPDFLDYMYTFRIEIKKTELKKKKMSLTKA